MDFIPGSITDSLCYFEQRICFSNIPEINALE